MAPNDPISKLGKVLAGGPRFLKATEKGARACEKETNKMIPKMGKRAPVCYEVLGRLLAQADIIGSCFFGCPGNVREGHTIQYLCARSSSFGRGALQLAKMGFYDEALTLVRSLGEIANLLSLFFFDKTSLEKWKKSDRQYRHEHFGPGKVRKRLGKDLPMDGKRYGLLCELSTHPVPELLPQVFNQHGKSMVGGIIVQEAGFLVVLNETTVLIASVVLFSVLILKLPKDVREVIQEDCMEAIDAAGGVNLRTFRDLLSAKRVVP